MMKKVSVFDEAKFSDGVHHRFLIHDSEHFKMLNFNFKAGQSLPVHSHDIAGQLSIVVLSGEGEFLSKGDPIPAKAGDVLISDIAEPHGVRATTDMRVLVTIAPPV
jgi:quercetin dioxygenase-like cupin family protein